MIETYLSIGKGKELMAEPPAEISTYLPIKALRSMLKTWNSTLKLWISVPCMLINFFNDIMKDLKKKKKRTCYTDIHKTHIHMYSYMYAVTCLFMNPPPPLGLIINIGIVKKPSTNESSVLMIKIVLH